MPIISVLKMGNPLLFTKADSVDITKIKSLKNIICDMLDTMQHFNGVGISAPQIGINQRIIMYGIDNNPRYPHAKPIPLTIMINPIFKIIDDNRTLDWEGCLSVPGLRGKIARWQKILCTGFDVQGNPFEKIVENFEARIIQHECDHLDGILFPARIKNFNHFSFESELKNI